MTQPTYPPADRPTMYFIGVTTAKSSIMRVFPEWATFLELGDCRIRGIDLAQHDEPGRYREVVEHIKCDPLSLGALVTTHKIDLLAACKDQFDDLDEFAERMGEISSISKRAGRLVGHAKDPITSGLALEAFLPDRYWQTTGAEVFVMGAGGSAIAVTWHLMKREHPGRASLPPATARAVAVPGWLDRGANRPAKIIVANRTRPRLHEIETLHKQFDPDFPTEYHHTPQPEKSDAIVGRLAPGSLVINATGLGKDWPGSPLTDAAVFPERGIAWDFNYRGDLVFLDQARAQQKARNLRIEDGWLYFIHGWTRVIAEVFGVDIPVEGPVFDELSAIAARVRG